jgi:HlyD family secretion protein
MIRLPALHLFPILLAAAAQAGEILIEQGPFTQEQSFSATALPEQGAVLIQIDPLAWTDFELLEVAAHGSKVAKGEVLVRFDPESIDNKLIDSKRALEAGALALAQAEVDLKHLEETTPHRLEAYKLAAEVAKEEYSYFTKIRRKATEEQAAQELERKKQMLSNQQEELKQLGKMYDADDVTEETEEIILTRQKDDVIAAEFALRMETLDYKRTLEVTLPREAISLANNERDTALDFLKAQEDLPRELARKKIELSTLNTNQEREKEAYANLEKDRALFEIKAPADGWFYHGPVENGRWTTGDLVKSLVKHGRPSPNKAFATFVPATAKLAFTAFLEETTAGALKPELTGTATLLGREDIEIPVKLAALSPTPAADGAYRADFTATWPKGLTAVTGATASLRIISYHKDAAIAVPTRALHYDTRGWSVEVKLADGKTEKRPVKRGRIAADLTEIVAGLEVGQVIISPGK